MSDSLTSPKTQSTCPDDYGHSTPDSRLSTTDFLAHIVAGTWNKRADSTSNLSRERATLATTVSAARTEGEKGLTLERKEALRRQVLAASTASLVADFVEEHSRKPTDDELAVLQTEGKAILKDIPALKLTFAEELSYYCRP